MNIMKERKSLGISQLELALGSGIGRFKLFMIEKGHQKPTAEELKKIADLEKYFDDVKPEFEALQTKIVHNKKTDLVKYKKEIKQLIESEIASRYYFQKGRLEASVKEDEQIKKAIEVLGDDANYKSLLTTIVKSERPFNALVLKKEQEKNGNEGK